jgi:hypothetical protein
MSGSSPDAGRPRVSVVVPNKSVPGSLLVKHLPRLLYGQLDFTRLREPPLRPLLRRQLGRLLP